MPFGSCSGALAVSFGEGILKVLQHVVHFRRDFSCHLQQDANMNWDGNFSVFSKADMGKVDRCFNERPFGSHSKVI